MNYTTSKQLSRIDTAVNAGAVDYIVAPLYKAPAKNRINSIIASVKVCRFNIEKEINFAILDMKKRAEWDCPTGLLNRVEFESVK